MKKSVVLLSGGLDSTVNLYAARNQSQVVLALTFNYGQRAAKREIEAAAELCRLTNTAHQVVELPWFSSFTRTSLVNERADVPVGDQIKIDDIKASVDSAKAVWVPNRNGVFLNIAAAFAEGWGADWVVPGFNAEEAATFPDNTQEFLDASTSAFAFSTSSRVEAKCFTTALSKIEIVRLGRTLGVAFDAVWPCYFAGQEKCGQCESCQRYLRAMREA